MAPEVRADLAARMSDEARNISLAGIFARHPEYDGARARRALFRLLLGDDVVRMLWPGEALVQP